MSEWLGKAGGLPQLALVSSIAPVQPDCKLDSRFLEGRLTLFLIRFSCLNLQCFAGDSCPLHPSPSGIRLTIVACGVQSFPALEGVQKPHLSHNVTVGGLSAATRRRRRSDRLIEQKCLLRESLSEWLGKAGGHPQLALVSSIAPVQPDCKLDSRFLEGRLTLFLIRFSCLNLQCFAGDSCPLHPSPSGIRLTIVACGVQSFPALEGIQKPHLSHNITVGGLSAATRRLRRAILDTIPLLLIIFLYNSHKGG